MRGYYLTFNQSTSFCCSWTGNDGSEFKQISFFTSKSRTVETIDASGITILQSPSTRFVYVIESGMTPLSCISSKSFKACSTWPIWKSPRNKALNVTTVGLIPLQSIWLCLWLPVVANCWVHLILMEMEMRVHFWNLKWWGFESEWVKKSNQRSKLLLLKQNKRKAVPLSKPWKRNDFLISLSVTVDGDTVKVFSGQVKN